MAHVLYGSNLKFSFSLLVSIGVIAPLPLVSQKRPVHVCVCASIRAQRVRFHVSDVTVDGAEAWKSDPSLPPEIALWPRVNPLD